MVEKVLLMRNDLAAVLFRRRSQQSILSSYLVDLITQSAAASTRAGLRSAESITVAVPHTLSSFGDRSFATGAWNKLPSHLRLMQSADTFRRHLKTFLFHQAFLS